MSEKTPRSFNTFRHSNLQKRKEKRVRARATLLAICFVIILLFLSLAVFLFCSIANIAKGSDEPQDTKPPVSDVTEQTQKISKSNTEIHSGPLIIVSEQSNYQYQYPEIMLKSFADADINVKQNGVYPYKCTDLKSNERMEITAAKAADKMLTDFYLKFSDSSLSLLDAYRTKEEQDGKSTPTGFSEHETGYVFTLQKTSLASNPYNVWIYENCASYGIIKRYPDEKEDLTGIDGYENCFRYVGVAHATYMTRNNLCLEEYISLLQKEYSKGARLKITGADGMSYEVYYVEKAAGDLTTITIPKGYAYSISGDNVGGFIVTVNRSAPTE